jgi:hypothetical protein
VDQYKLDSALILGLRQNDVTSNPLYNASHLAVIQAVDDVLEEGEISSSTWKVLECEFPDSVVRSEIPVCVANWLQFSVLLKSLRMPPDGPMAWPPDNGEQYLLFLFLSLIDFTLLFALF